MRETIRQYVKMCDTWQPRKVVRHVPYRKLQPDEIPNQLWKSITIDFITDLPKTDEYNTILVVVECLTKMSHFIRCKKDINTWQFTSLFRKEIIQLHGISEDVITDRGTLFMSGLLKQTTESRNWREFEQGIPSGNGWTDRTDKWNTQTLSRRICELSMEELEWAISNGRVRQ